MTCEFRATAAAALAVALSASALHPVFAGSGWLLRVLGAVLVVALAAHAVRRSGRLSAWSPVAGLVALLAYAGVVFAAGTLAWGVLPGRATASALGALWSSGRADVRAYGPPVPVTPGLALLAVLGVGAVAIAVDTLAVVAARPAAAGLPLLLLLAVPSAVLTGGVGTLPFALGAAGWLGLLLVAGGGPEPGPSPGRGAAGSEMRAGRRIGVAALGLAVIVPALLPGLDTRLFAGNGAGSGSGSGRSATTVNPITRLRGELSQPSPQVLLTYTSTDPSPDYLRLTTLDSFDGTTWSSSPLRGALPQDAVGNGLPTPTGLGDVAGRDVVDDIAVRSLRGSWLPLPFPTLAVGVTGPWIFDRASQTAFATRTDAGRTPPYQVHALRLNPSPDALRSADVSDQVVAAYRAPVVVSDKVSATTQAVVRGLTNPYDEALALQAWFRDPGNGFRYDLRTIDGPADPLTDFLDNRVGYCEQYASAMAAMLRVLGIPSRVGVGFTPGTRQPDGSWAVRTSDAHAWPEAWFSGTGWVRFEPTPGSGGRIAPPAYSLAPVVGPGDPGTTPTDTSSAAPEATTGSDGLVHVRDPELRGSPATTRPSPAVGGQSSRQLPRWPFVGVLVLLVAAGPMLLGLTRRRLRARTPGPASAWAQLRDDGCDVGVPWLPVDSLRTFAARLGVQGRLRQPAAEALDRVVRAAEMERYARPDDQRLRSSVAGLLGADVAVVRRELLAAASPAVRWRARLLPPSALRWASRSLGCAVADGLDRFDQALGSTARVLRPAGRRAARD